MSGHQKKQQKHKQKTKLKDDEAKCLKTYYIKLKDVIDVKDIIDELYSKDVLSTDDKEEIEAEKTRIAKVNCLLKKIENPGLDGRFQIFIDSLKNYETLQSEMKAFLESNTTTSNNTDDGNNTPSPLTQRARVRNEVEAIASPHLTKSAKETRSVVKASTSTYKKTKELKSKYQDVHKLSKGEIEEQMLPLLENLDDQANLTELLQLTCNSTKPPQIPTWQQKQSNILEYTVNNIIGSIDKSQDSISLDLLLNSLETQIVIIGIRASKETIKADNKILKLLNYLVSSEISTKVSKKNMIRLQRICFSSMFYMIDRKYKLDGIQFFNEAQEIFFKVINHPNEIMKEVLGSLLKSFQQKPWYSGKILQLSLHYLKDAKKTKGNNMVLKNGLDVPLLLSVVEKLSFKEFDLLGKEVVKTISVLLLHFLLSPARTKKSLGTVKYVQMTTSCMIIICNIFLHDKKASEFTSKEIKKIFNQCLKEDDEILTQTAAVTMSLVGNIPLDLQDAQLIKLTECLSSSLQDVHNKCFCGLSVGHLMHAMEQFLKEPKYLDVVMKNVSPEKIKTWKSSVQKQNYSVKESFEKISTKLNSKGKRKIQKRRLANEDSESQPSNKKKKMEANSAL